MKNLCTILLFLFGTSPLTAQVAHLVISQVYAGGGNSGASFNADFVELFNPTPAPVNLEGWSIQYSSAGGSTWAGRPIQGTIDPGKYFLIKMSNDGVTGSSVPLPDLMVTPQLALATSGGEVALVKVLEGLTAGCNKDSSVVDLLGYGSAACHETAPATAGSSSKSMHRINNGCTDSDNNSEDFVTATPAPRNSKAPASVCGRPVALLPSNLTPVSFVAKWKAFASANSYGLDVLRDGSSMDPETSVLAGWTFPLDGANTLADAANGANSSASLTTTAGVITDAAGATTRSASANLWTDGAGAKYWQISVDARGYSNLKLSSQQRSSGTGPRDFAVQYRIGAVGDWIPVQGGTLALTNDFAEGILSELALPSNADDQSEIHIRWMMTSNVSVSEALVSNSGTSRIDNILVRGNGTIDVEFVAGYENRAVADTNLLISGLEPDTRYYYRVRAVASGSSSATSNTIELTTPPLVPLPVHLINVKATRHQKGMLISWTNPLEEGIAYYEVEGSTSGGAFLPLARKLPAANSGDLVSYKYLDSVQGAARMYRVRVVEADGVETRSIVVGWAEALKEHLEIYPNPVTAQKVTLGMNSVPAGTYALSIYNSSGQQVHTTTIRHGAVISHHTISLHRLKPGIYFLQLLGPVQLRKQLLLVH